MKKSYYTLLFFNFLIGQHMALDAQGSVSIQIGNKDLRGDESLYPRFAIVADFDDDTTKEKHLNENAMAVFNQAPDTIKKLSWVYHGPPPTFVLHPASVSSSIASPFREFILERPEDLKVRATSRIQRKMNDSVPDGWKAARNEVRKMRDIFNQTEEEPAANDDLKPTTLRRYYLSLLRDCSSPAGWDRMWDERTSPLAIKELYYECAREYGLELVKLSAGYSDALTRQCLSNGLDAWFHSHEKRRTDAWRNCLVKDVITLPDWTNKEIFGSNLLEMLIELQVHYDVSKSDPNGLKIQMINRIANYDVNWDDKKRFGLKKLNEILTERVSEKANALEIIGEMRLSEWENMIDALKLLYKPL